MNFQLILYEHNGLCSGCYNTVHNCSQRYKFTYINILPQVWIIMTTVPTWARPPSPAVRSVLRTACVSHTGTASTWKEWAFPQPLPHTHPSPLAPHNFLLLQSGQEQDVTCLRVATASGQMASIQLQQVLTSRPTGQCALDQPVQADPTGKSSADMAGPLLCVCSFLLYDITDYHCSAELTVYEQCVIDSVRYFPSLPF